MKHDLIRYGKIVLMISLVTLSAGRANAQERHRNEIHLESLSWGMSSGQTVRVNVVNFVFSDGSVRASDPVIARIQLLDTEGEVVAQSQQITVASGKTRFWDAPYEQIGGVRGPNGRLQLRARILVEEGSLDRNRPPLASLEIFDYSTGATKSHHPFYNPYITVDYVESATPQQP